MPPRRLILVAHGATDATRRGAFPDAAETLEPAAVAAASALAAVLPTPARALVSPAGAAVATAAALGLDAHHEPALRDLDTGSWAGLTPAEVAPEDLAAWLSDADWAGHGGESLAALLRRLDGFLAAHLADGGVTLAITHAAVIRAALAAALGAPASAFWRVDAAPLHALALAGDGRRWALRGLGPLASVMKASGG